jgi:hypothetical protein
MREWGRVRAPLGGGGGGGVKATPVPAMPAGRTAGFSPAERLDAAQRLEPAVFSPAEQAVCPRHPNLC